ncbi:MAG: PAS domain S-box protein [Burkholderiales bacterium]
MQSRHKSRTSTAKASGATSGSTVRPVWATVHRLAAEQRTLLDSLPDVTWIKDRDSRLTLVNRAFAERYRITADDAVGLTDFDIYPAEKAAQLREEDLRVMVTRQPLRYESTLTIDGSEFWVEIVKAPVIDAEGTVIGTVGTSRDITARKAAEQASERSQQRLELALEGSGLVFWDIDLGTGKAHMSDGWAKLLGLPPGETLTTVDELVALVHPDDLPLAQKLSVESIRNLRNDYMVEHRVRVADGSWKWILSRGRVTARDGNGRALRMSGTNLDITARKSMENSLRQALDQSDTLLETTPTAIAVTREDVIVRSNVAMDRMFGFKDQEERPLAELFPGAAEWNEAKARIDAALADQRSFNGELELQRTDGTRLWVVAAARPVQPGSPEILFALTDVTELRRLTSQFESAKEAADAANRAKSGFLAAMSHEIRTPMNGVLGMLELLALTELNQEQRESLFLAHNSAISLLRLIDDILDFSKIEAGQLEIKPEPLSLQILAESAITVYHELAARKNLELTSSISPGLEGIIYVGDGLRISQIINNLLSNAIKFTEHGSVRLQLERTAGTDGFDTIRIRVTDTGSGIPPEQQSRLFRPFVQGESESARRLGGTGLGLSICRRLAKLMGGNAELRSTPGAGTEVTCTIRLAVADTEIISKYQAQKLAGQAATVVSRAKTSDALILVVEDHPVNRMLLQRQVSLLGYRTDFAADGVEALEKIRSHHYDLVLTDCHMPNKDGYQLTRDIRAMESAAGITSALPIIACTANALPSDADQCLEAGMNDYLSKPITLKSLSEKISRWLRTDREVAATTQAVAGTALPEKNAPLDPAALDPYTQGNPKLRQDILDQFDDANEADLAALRIALESGQAETLARSAHRIKGAARMIGAGPLAAAAERIEQHARSGHLESAADLRGDLEHEAARLKACIRQLAGDSAGGRR